MTVVDGDASPLILVAMVRANVKQMKIVNAPDTIFVKRTVWIRITFLWQTSPTIPSLLDIRQMINVAEGDVCLLARVKRVNKDVFITRIVYQVKE